MALAAAATLTPAPCPVIAWRHERKHKIIRLHTSKSWFERAELTKAGMVCLEPSTLHNKDMQKNTRNRVRGGAHVFFYANRGSPPSSKNFKFVGGTCWPQIYPPAPTIADFAFVCAHNTHAVFLVLAHQVWCLSTQMVRCSSCSLLVSCCVSKKKWMAVVRPYVDRAEAMMSNVVQPTFRAYTPPCMFCLETHPSRLCPAVQGEYCSIVIPKQYHFRE
eukprot:g67467.t1